MPSQRTYRVFVSYTGKDLAAHADVVAKVLRALQHLAIDHRDSGATGEPSVRWCMEQVDRADFLVVLVAHRYGWVPTSEEGGDGRKSITQMEVDRANATGKIVLPYIIEDDAPWPGDQFEALTRPEILEDLNRFKSELRRGVASFFAEPASLDGPLSRDIPRAIARIEKANRPVIAADTSTGERLPVAPWIYHPDDPPSLEDRMAGGLPKRILSLQGGGVHAAITIGYLERIERLLQVRYGEADFRLGDYFDLIGGVGPSSLLALELARRRSVSEAADSFRYVLERGFKKRFSLLARVFRPLYSDGPLRQALEDRFGDLRLTDAAFATGFALITTSLASARPVVISNHPDLVSELGQGARVAGVAFACLARPGYFTPAVVVDPQGHQQALVEGEASIGPDPSLALLLLVTSSHFPFRWRIGQHRLYMTAIGFETKAAARTATEFRSGAPLKLIGRLLESLTVGAAYQSRMVLEALAIEGPAGDVGLLEQSAVVTYRRYETGFETEDLARLGMRDMGELRSAMRHESEFFDRFARVGHAAAARDIVASHLPGAFDVRVPVETSPTVTAEAKR